MSTPVSVRQPPPGYPVRDAGRVSRTPAPVSIVLSAPDTDDSRWVLRAYFEDLASRHYRRSATGGEIDAAMAEDSSDDLTSPRGLFFLAYRDAGVTSEARFVREHPADGDGLDRPERAGGLAELGQVGHSRIIQVQPASLAQLHNGGPRECLGDRGDTVKRGHRWQQPGTHLSDPNPEPTPDN